MTPDQKNAIKALLSVNLATVSDDRLIELCLLHRSQPDALETFPAALKAEIARRFTGSVIRQRYVAYSVLQNFSNQFESPLPMMAQKLKEMAATVNRDIWFTNNETLFKDALNTADVMAWVVTQDDILTKCLHNTRALGWIAQSEVASTAILTNANALHIWKNTPKLWSTWVQNEVGMKVILKSEELASYLFSVQEAREAVFARSNVLDWVMASSFGFAGMCNPDALKTVVATDDLRTRFINKNSWWQAEGQRIYNAVSAPGSGWRKSRTMNGAHSVMNSSSSSFSTPAGLVFGCFGKNAAYSQSPDSPIVVRHPGGGTAAQGINDIRVSPSTIVGVDVITFNAFHSVRLPHSGNYLCLELWTPA